MNTTTSTPNRPICRAATEALGKREMKRILSICILGVILGACIPPSRGEPTNGATITEAKRHGERTTVVLSGVQEFDVEVVSFRATNKRRQSWVFGFQKLDRPEAFVLELLDDDHFATTFIKDRPVFVKEYWAEHHTAIKEHKQWDYAKPVNPHPRFHIKVDASMDIARILEWKKIDTADAKPPVGGDGKPAPQP